MSCSPCSWIKHKQWCRGKISMQHWWNASLHTIPCLYTIPPSIIGSFTISKPKVSSQFPCRMTKRWVCLKILGKTSPVILCHILCQETYLSRAPQFNVVTSLCLEGPWKNTAISVLMPACIGQQHWSRGHDVTTCRRMFFFLISVCCNIVQTYRFRRIQAQQQYCCTASFIVHCFSDVVTFIALSVRGLDLPKPWHVNPC